MTNASIGTTKAGGGSMAVHAKEHPIIRDLFMFSPLKLSSYGRLQELVRLTDHHGSNNWVNVGENTSISCEMSEITSPNS
jgi:hypothetical protein